MRLAVLLPAASLFVRGSVVLDFRSRAAETNGWTFSGTTYNADRGLKFAQVDAFAESPAHASAVTSVTVVTYCSGARLDEPFRVEVRNAAAAWTTCEPAIGYVYCKYATNTFSFAAADDVRVVRVRSAAMDEVPGNYYLTALVLRGVDDEETPDVDPPPGGDDPPGELDPLTDHARGAWRVSEFEDGVRTETFDWVTNVLKATVWTNGVTVAGFHAYKNGDVIDTIGRDSGRATKAGLYASATSGVWNARSLSLLGSGSAALSLELPLLNDSPTQQAIGCVDVSFTAYQWTFPDKGERTLSAAWAVTRTLARPDAWRTCGSAALVSSGTAPTNCTYRAVSLSLSTGKILVPPGGLFWMRWSTEKATGAPMVGVGDVQVRISFLAEPTVLTFR